MPTSATVTNAAKEIFPYGVDLETQSAANKIKCALFTASATITATSTLYSGLTNEVASGNGYTTGGNVVSDLTWSGTTTKTITGTIANWTSATFTFRYAIIYDTDTSRIIGYYDFGSNQEVVQGTVALSFDTDGLLKVTSS